MDYDGPRDGPTLATWIRKHTGVQSILITDNARLEALAAVRRRHLRCAEC